MAAVARVESGTARSWNSLWLSLVSTWIVRDCLHCFSRCIGKKLGWKLLAKNRTALCYGMLVSQ